MARCAELSQFACLPDLAEHVLEKVALGVSIHTVEVQIVQLTHHLREHCRLVDHQSRAVHEVRGSVPRQFSMERKHLLPHPIDQPLAVQRVRPRRPAHQFAPYRVVAVLGSIARVAQPPVPLEGARVGRGARSSRRPDPSRVRRLVHVEVDQEAELLRVLRGIGIAAAEQVVADTVHASAQFRRHRHRRFLNRARQPQDPLRSLHRALAC